MGILTLCKANAAEAAIKALDPSLTFEARAKWKQISRDWEMLAEQTKQDESLECLLARGPQDTIH
jgi:hypothetical protein